MTVSSCPSSPSGALAAFLISLMRRTCEDNCDIGTVSSNADVRRDVYQQNTVLQSSTPKCARRRPLGSFQRARRRYMIWREGTEHHRAVALYMLRFVQLRSKQSCFIQVHRCRLALLCRHNRRPHKVSLGSEAPQV